jgi:hypothetical protein
LAESNDGRSYKAMAGVWQLPEGVILDPKLTQSIASSINFQDFSGIRAFAESAAFRDLQIGGHLAEKFQKSIVANFSNLILPNSISLSIVQASGIMSQLEKIQATFVPQLVGLNNMYSAEMGLSEVFRKQIEQLVSAQNSINQLINTANISTSAIKLFESVERYGQTNAHLAAATIQSGQTPLLRGNTAYASRLYNSYLESLPARPIARRAAVAQYAGDTQTGLLIAESLTTPSTDTGAQEILAEQLNSTVLEPWQSGPAEARIDLFEVLAELDPGLPDWLKAAWDDIVRDGPKAASKIANCTVECIDRALRVAAPLNDVSDWLLTIPNRPEYRANGKPTRRAKVMYVMRDRADRDAKLAATQVDTLAGLVQEVVQNLQSVKHGEAPSMATMRSWVLAAEGALSQLFLRA